MSQIVLYAFFAPGIQEVVIVLAIGFLLFGAQRLPKIAHSIGSSFIAFKSGISGLEDDLKTVSDDIEKEIKK